MWYGGRDELESLSEGENGKISTKQDGHAELTTRQVKSKVHC
jgi:hypothetical protein